METLGTILLIILIIYGLIRLLSPFLLRLFIKRIGKQFFNNQENFAGKNRTKRTRREGEITIENNNSRDKIIDKNIGDYVDFEEDSKI